MEIDFDIKREEVEKIVREFLEGYKGKKMKTKAMEWKKLVEEATGLLGSSSINLKNLVSEVLLSEGKCTLLLSLNLGFVTSLVFKLPLNLLSILFILANKLQLYLH